MLILVPKYHPSLSRPSHCLFLSHHGSSPDKEGSLSFPLTEVIQTSYPACIKKKQIVWLAPSTPPSLANGEYQDLWTWRPFIKIEKILKNIFQGTYKDQTPKMILWFTFYRQFLKDKFLLWLYDPQLRSRVQIPPRPTGVLSHAVNTALSSAKRAPETDRPRSLASR